MPEVQEFKMSKINQNRIRLALSLLLIAFTVSTLFYTAHEMHHECSGDDCPICYIIQNSLHSLKLFSLALTFFFIYRIFKNTRKNKSIIFAKSVLESTNLVSQKIRLNN